MNKMKKATTQLKTEDAAGFSLIELMIAMTITLILMAAASTLLATSLSTRTRENQRSDAQSAAQRALHIISREVANSGFGLNDSNGIVASESNATRIRILTNVHNNAAADPILATNDPDEDVTFVYQAANRSIVRFDKNRPTNNTTVLASGIDTFQINYLDANDANVAPANATKVRFDVRVSLPAAFGQPATIVRLMSEVTLRNAPNLVKRY
ncbi:MAG TPA: prepilin-type N-terminal cleavage/methylation domain-containing protein [Pyrinomonadaceae bacterium]|nr:prepilin-type N-terminal cleavage/methylation domain-containing protein [Pyrinomonadaceae bacterium]